MKSKLIFYLHSLLWNVFDPNSRSPVLIPVYIPGRGMGTTS